MEAHEALEDIRFRIFDLGIFAVRLWKVRRFYGSNSAVNSKLSFFEYRGFRRNLSDKGAFLLQESPRNGCARSY